MPFTVDSSRTLSPARLQELARQRRSPWPESPAEVLLLYQGQAHTRHVELAGELTRWNSQHLRLQRGPSQLFHLAIKLPADARIEYKFLVDGEWMLDPWNPLRVINGIGGINSAIEMPGYRHDPRLQISGSVRRLDNLLLEGKALPGTRRLQIYTPPKMQAGKLYPTLYFQDGSDYIQRAQLPWLLDRMIMAGEIPPVIAVCIDPLNRSREYACNPAYGHLLLDEILPLIEARYPVSRRWQDRTMVGSSLGGLISSFVASSFENSFGQVLGQSSSFQYAGDKFRHMPRRPLRFYLSAGRFEGLLQANRNLVRSLGETGYDYKYREHNEGHNWTHWSNRLPEGLIYLLNNKA